MNHYDKVGSYLLDLEYEIVTAIPEEQIYIVRNLDAGINNLVVDCEDPILILESPFFPLNTNNAASAVDLLKKNREIVHGAFALTEDNMLIYRDTLQLENLDLNELEGTLNSLELLLAEHANNLIELSKN